MKQCTCFALKAINCICDQREDENSFAYWFYSAPHRIKYLRDHPAFLAAEEAWEASKKQIPPQRQPLSDEQIFEVHKKVDSMQYLTFARAIEAAHGIKE